MINGKKHLIALGLLLILPLSLKAEAPVVDDSDRFALTQGEQGYDDPASRSKYDNRQIARNDYTADGFQDDDGPALAQDDQQNAALKSSASLIDKIQGLQQELQELRGQLEVQAHDLKLLQQQQVAFYKDLDARISGNATQSAKSLPSNPTVSPRDKSATINQNNQQPSKDVAAVLPTNSARTNPADEQISYLAAYELVQNRNYDSALTAMNQFVQKYPRGGYTANAQYWLGELYLVKKDYAQAVDHFNVVLQSFPTSSKSAASMLKMGYAYAALGNKPEAKKYLLQVVRAFPNTPTAELANTKLQKI